MTAVIGPAQTAGADLDAAVIGAGFGGLYMLYRLRDGLGLKTRLYDRASGIGGTWYWNRYPGALSDSETFVYCYSFDQALLQDRDWTTRYIAQPDILAYLEHVAERLDLLRDTQLDTGLRSARFDEASGLWMLGFDTGETVRAKYLVTALGLLSATNLPPIAGQDIFEGQQIHTGHWPREGVDLSGKRVGVIGTGSTGLQVITALAPTVAQLTVFQRSPQYCVPIGNGPVTPEQVAAVKADYPAIWSRVRDSVVAFGFEESTVPAMSVSEAERQRVFEAAWQAGGGFRFMFATFSDIATDPAANEAACRFIRGKIAETVHDPAVARKLMPTGPYAKRPLCANDYYAVYNRPNVELVDVKADPLLGFTPRGVRTASGEHALDVVIYATGFEAVDGNYVKVDIRGRGGLSIRDAWAAGPTSYLGVSTTGFPNLFMVLGPNGPFTNLPPSIETQVEWIAGLIERAEARGPATVEARRAAEDSWTRTCQDVAAMTLFPKAESWIFGANTPGRANTVMFYMGGLKAYRGVLAQEQADGFPGFAFGAPLDPPEAVAAPADIGGAP